MSNRLSGRLVKLEAEAQAAAPERAEMSPGDYPAAWLKLLGWFHRWLARESDPRAELAAEYLAVLKEAVTEGAGPMVCDWCGICFDRCVFHMGAARPWRADDPQVDPHYFPVSEAEVRQLRERLQIDRWQKPAASGDERQARCAAEPAARNAVGIQRPNPADRSRERR